jgi:hypothetical protein
VARVGRAVGESLAGAAATDPTTVAAEMLTAARSPASLLARGHQVFKGAYVIEGLTLPGLAADEVISVEIRGALRAAARGRRDLAVLRDRGQREPTAPDSSAG